MNLEFEITENVKFSTDVDDEEIMQGGVYIFYIDNIPLYIGETYYFLDRLSTHLFKAKKEPAYFGLGELKGPHELAFEILDPNFPYRNNEIMDKQYRKGKEKIFIKDRHPILQNPFFYKDKPFSSKNDFMFQLKNRNSVVVENIKKVKLKNTMA